ncbi:GDSL-type esterase/lipase family protein [Sulfuriroseicoccus oceanibius]|uniref:SGNH hydrolase-type esterase domain-containing protein n=1 Tax=Sulfuriroseicoccus oceanibius TaxID=2707525 RepID=A0A6B3L712_9BACT|nr:GDSL-type esterase/lipase family protein [Sulfuriroseicoccus oceanibius]QQL45208.1 hypothetical protein G3M56_001065 [Sulfuriroseicoccus oceanibius]
MHRFFLLITLILGTLAPSFAKPTTKVACVGDSITFGATIVDRERLSYPAQLAARLGNAYEVRNFGVSARTILSKGDRPYIATQQYQAALQWKPDAVILMLGTNDSKPHNWKHRDEFLHDATSLIESFQQLPSSPRVLVCVPPPVFKEGVIRNAPIRDHIRPALHQAAITTGAEIIDFTPFLIEHARHFPDAVHPTALGAEVLAQRLSMILRTPRVPVLGFEGLGERLKQGHFHGHPMVEFEADGVPARIVRPRRPAAGYPWIWRARFWNHEPQFDRAMLELGWHIAYIDVSHLYGSQKAIDRWNKFHNLLTSQGLSNKPIIEAMSRGGLIAHNWAAANPTKVAGIYADNPVMDIKSWPLGMPGAGSPKDIPRLIDAYNFTSKEDALAWNQNPVDQIHTLASARVPAFYVVGSQDKVVPTAANAERAISAYLQAGAPVEVIRKPQAGHHPHSLVDPTPLVHWALRCAGTPMNPAAAPTPGAEFRGRSAGWGSGTWWDQFERINQLSSQHQDLELVFLGDSITQSWTGSHHRLATADGNRAIDRTFGKHWKTASFGISGDRTEHLLYRVQHGNFDHISPKVIVLTIGVNNLNIGKHTPAQVADGIKATVNALRTKCPRSHILVLGPLPSGRAPDAPRRTDIRTIHHMIAPLGAHPQVTYKNISNTFILADGTLNPELFTSDFIHLKPAGYDAWAKAIKDDIQRLMR